MGVTRLAVVAAMLALSVPVYAQPGRYGGDRGRDDRGKDRGNRSEDRDDKERGNRREGRRDEPRGGGGIIGRVEPRYGGPDNRDFRRDRRDEPRIAVRTPVYIDRYPYRERGPRFVPPGHMRREVYYRYGDRDWRQREYVTITAWFRSLPPARLTAYGYYGPDYGHVRYAFRPGIYLSMAVYGQLGILPYDLEDELGELPWYLERRIYGDTVLVIDSRTRQVVDIFELDD
ncbi:MAG TPA: hypothetical protein VGJ96_14760 [Gemmatimonadaceae bacterium]|jgi:hypothetical protein